jgi:hypothetical protein
MKRCCACRTTGPSLCRSINGFGPTPGSRIVLLGDPGASPTEPTSDERRPETISTGQIDRDRKTVTGAAWPPPGPDAVTGVPGTCC